jgi:carboxymethylenebutenolidase
MYHDCHGMKLVRRPLRTKLRLVVYVVVMFVVAWRLAEAQSQQAAVVRTVVVPSGELRLKALLWIPAGLGPFPTIMFNHGRSDDAVHTGGMAFRSAAETLGPIFVRHGYAFFYLFRRGEGLSADQGNFIGKALDREAAAKGEEARRHLQFVLMSSDHLNDVISGLSFLKTIPEVDATRIAIVGHSFGAQLTLLAAESNRSLRAAVSFAAAANSWSGSAELRDRLLSAMRNMNMPVMLIHAANDYSVVPGEAMAEELVRLNKPHVLKIYPRYGITTDDGHNVVYLAIPQWENDVFPFLDMYVKR